MSDTVISVENVSKIYRLGEIGTGSLAHDVNRWWHRVRGKEDPYLKVGKVNDRTQATQKSEGTNGLQDDWVFALKDINFDIKQGEVLGIIGRNGAGKSTLLKILSRVTSQTTGQIKIKGRIASLLEVGTGFHPELTGRENIFLNGAILGMRKQEITSKLDEIVEFSGCARYIDTPVKRYSSGMYVRLAFAVAAHLEPEILIVDEVLAVGDAEFQRKCIGKMGSVAREGRTIIFVSHNLTSINSLCSRALVLAKGSIAYDGEPSQAIQKYIRLGEDSPTRRTWDINQQAPGCSFLKLMRIAAVSLAPRLNSYFDISEPIQIQIEYILHHRIKHHITLHVHADSNEVAFTSGSSLAEDWSPNQAPGKYVTTCEIPANLLNAKTYSIRLLIVEDGTRVVSDHQEIISFQVKDLKPRETGSYLGEEPGVVSPKLKWSTKPIN